MKILVNGEEVHLVMKRDPFTTGGGIKILDQSKMDDLTVVHEADPQFYKDGAQIHYKFTDQGLIIDAITDKEVNCGGSELWANIEDNLIPQNSWKLLG